VKGGDESLHFKMKKCCAYYPIAGSRSAWVPCVRKAEEGTPFCQRHGDAVFGAMLGALVYREPVNEVLSLESRDAKRIANGGKKKADPSRGSG